MPSRVSAGVTRWRECLGWWRGGDSAGGVSGDSAGVVSMGSPTPSCGVVTGCPRDSLPSAIPANRIPLQGEVPS